MPASAADAELGPWFGVKHAARFNHSHAHDRDSLMERVRSMSFVAVLPDDARQEIYATVARLLERHPDLAGRAWFTLDYVARAFWVERVTAR